MTIYPIVLTKRCEHHVAHEPADLLTHAVTGRGIANIAGLEHGQSPAIHGNVLGGRKEVQDEVERCECRHVRDSETLTLKQELSILGPWTQVLDLIVYSPTQCQVAHHHQSDSLWYDSDL